MANEASGGDPWGLLRRLEPHLDAIVCYASTMGEHEPNRLANDVRAALTRQPPQPPANPVDDALVEARFLCERTRELESSLADDETAAHYYGHVVPALARCEAALKAAQEPSRG